MGSLGVPFEITDGLDAVWGYEPSVDGLGRFMRETVAHDEDDIRAINHPTLLIHGRDDKVLPLSTTLTLLDWIDDGRAHLFGRCGHWTQSEHTAEFCAQVADFLSRGCAPTSR